LVDAGANVAVDAARAAQVLDGGDIVIFDGAPNGRRYRGQLVVREVNCLHGPEPGVSVPVTRPAWHTLAELAHFVFVFGTSARASCCRAFTRERICFSVCASTTSSCPF
jgi:hypothetical protein